MINNRRRERLGGVSAWIGAFVGHFPPVAAGKPLFRGAATIGLTVLNGQFSGRGPT
jgi:hypothetical protein